MISAPSTLSSTTVLRRVVEEIWNGQQLEVAEALIAPSYVNHGSLITDLVRGPEAITTSVTLYRQIFPHLTVAIEALECVDEVTVMRWRVVADGRETDGNGVMAGTLRAWIINGRMHESWMEWDRAALLRHLAFLGDLELLGATSHREDNEDVEHLNA